MDMPSLTPASLSFSRIGLGCVTFGREIDEPMAHAMMDRALALGIRHFDTARIYGNGESERIIGRWLASRSTQPHEVTLATKLLPPYTPERIRLEAEESQRSLGRQNLDLLYLHRWEKEAEDLATLRALDALVRGGAVRAIGVSNCTRDQLRTALDIQKRHRLATFSVVQNNHNLAVRDADEAYRGYCASEGVTVVTYSPLGAGFLTGKHKAGVERGSRFDVVPGHQDVYFHEQSYKRLQKLEQTASRLGVGQAHLAMAWALNQPGVSCVLVGGRSPAHLEQAVAALAFKDPDLLRELGSDGE